MKRFVGIIMIVCSAVLSGLLVGAAPSDPADKAPATAPRHEEVAHIPDGFPRRHYRRSTPGMHDLAKAGDTPAESRPVTRRSTAQ